MSEQIRTDLLRDWCQAAEPPVQWSSPVQACGSTEDLEPVVRYGVLYNMCRRHRSESTSQTTIL